MQGVVHCCYNVRELIHSELEAEAARKDQTWGTQKRKKKKK